MIGGKSQSRQRPTAIGSMINRSTLGATIPTVMGMTKTALLAIWAANMRYGNSGKKGKGGKGKKGSPPTFVEDIDFLVGSNPMEGALQCWMNNNRYPLNFVKYRAAPWPTAPILTIPDSKFYFVIGVTTEVDLSGTFNDFGAQGPAPFSGTYEFPLWNAWQPGPNLVNPNPLRNWPYLYSWRPADLNVINFPQNFLADHTFGIPFGNGFVNVYYAQFATASHNRAPIDFNRMEWEEELGNGGEYADAGLSSQQIIYPFFAGLGSTDIDCGTTGLIPDIRIEAKGGHCVHATGDCDFVDMIEDVFLSGQLQVGAKLGLVQRGLNCNDLPGIVQAGMYASLEPSYIPITLRQPTPAGAKLLFFDLWRVTSGTDSSITDDAANAWTAVMKGAYYGAWYANALAYPAGNKIVGVSTVGTNYDGRGYAFEMDPSSDTIENTSVLDGFAGGTQNIVASIYVSKPSYIFLFAVVDGGIINAVNPLWKDLNPTNLPFGQPPMQKRYVAEAGVYSWKATIHGGNYHVAMIAVSQSQPSQFPQTLGDILDHDSLELTRLQCRANGLIGSVVMDAQRKAQEWLKEFYQCANAWPVWSGFKLKTIPRSEVSAVGMGAIYISPTSTGPVATLTESDLIGDPSQPLVVVKRSPPVDRNNISQIEHVQRSNDYNVCAVSEPESGAIAGYGPRKLPPIVLHEIQDSAVARKLNRVVVKNLVYSGNKYSFTAKAKWLGLEATDLVFINDSQLGLANKAVRLTSLKETKEYELQCEADEFVYGGNSPEDLAVTAFTPNTNNLNVDPGQVNAPIIFEPVPRLFGNQSQPQLWLVVSAPSPDYGGCLVLLSTNGGSSYNQVGSIKGNAITGFTVGDWPIANDPDTTNDLALNLTESLGVLSSYNATDRDNFTYPCYVAGGNAQIPYGLMTYNSAVLTSANHYTLKATGAGNELRRCVYGAPAALTDVDHPNNSRWAFLNPLGLGICKLNLDPSWIGKTLYFKFLAVNKFGGFVEEEADATAYPYTVAGTAAPSNPNSSSYSLTGGALTNPTSTTIHMAQATATFPSNSANYNARTFTIAAPGVPTTYYVTIYDPQSLGDTGALTNLSASADLTNANVGKTGYVYIGSITVLPAGGGTATTPGGSNPGDELLVNGVVIA